MIKELHLEDLMVGTTRLDYEQAMKEEPPEGYDLDDTMVNALSTYLRIQTRPASHWLEYDEVADEVIVAAFQIGYHYGNNAALAHAYKEKEE